MTDMKIRTSRAELYRYVWAKPLIEVAKEWGVQPADLVQACNLHNVPRPPSGYWTKKSYGKPVGTPELEGDGSTAVQLRRRSFLQPGATTSSTPPIALNEDMEKLHPLASKTRSGLKGAKPDAKGLLYPRALGCLSVAVTPSLVDQALRILDALVRGIEASNLTIKIDSNDPADRKRSRWREGGRPYPMDLKSKTTVHVLGEALEIVLHEDVRQRERRYTPEEAKKMNRSSWDLRDIYYEPTGTLILRILPASDDPWHPSARRTWSITGKRPVESILQSFLEGLPAAAVERSQERVEAKRRQEKYKEEQQLAEERARLRRMEEVKYSPFIGQ